MSESDHPSKPPEQRTMTPYAAWDSRPKIAVAKPVEPVAPEDLFRDIPRLFPRDARPPAISEYERHRAERDTEPTGPIDEAEQTPADEAEQTPARRPFEIRVEKRLDSVEKRLGKLEEALTIIQQSSRDTAQLTIETHELVKKIDRHQRELEIERKWIPAAAWLITTVIAVVALIRTFH